jgi:hypothetical protein
MRLRRIQSNLCGTANDWFCGQLRTKYRILQFGDLQFNLLQFKHAVQNHLLTQKISFEKRSITDLPEWFEMVCIVNCGSREEY